MFQQFKQKIVKNNFLIRAMIDKRLRIFAGLCYIISLILFSLGWQYPIMGAEMIFGIRSDEIYLYDSFQYFYQEGDYFIGTVLLIFTIIFPILKYIFLAITLLGFKSVQSKGIHIVLEAINKWAMLDVFVVALLIMTFQLDSTLLHNYLMIGTNYFVASILLLMLTSFLLLKME